MNNSTRHADVPDLIVALVDVSDLARPVLLTRLYPPTLIQLWRVFLRQQSHLTCWQQQLHAWGCRHLCLLLQHPLHPPSYPLPSVERYFYLWGEGPPIHSVLVARIHHHGSTHNASTNLLLLANVMAPRLLIHRSTFFAGGDIGPAHLTNLLRMDGLKR